MLGINKSSQHQVQLACWQSALALANSLCSAQFAMPTDQRVNDNRKNPL